jgi:hypothetical protein
MNRLHARTATIFGVLTAALFLLAAPAWAAPPDKVLDRILDAVSLLDSPRIAARFVMDSTATISDRNGRVQQVVEQRDQVTARPGIPVERQMISRTVKDEKGTKTGTDATSSASPNSPAQGSGWKLSFPAGRDKAFYSFGPERLKDGLLQCDFAPLERLPGDAPKDILTKGSITWNPATMQPVRLEAVPVKNPQFTSGLKFFYVFSTVQDTAYPSEIRFQGEGGFLFIQRGFDFRTTVQEFRRL